jgi:DNA-binding NarL/FixJ family response regulator
MSRQVRPDQKELSAEIHAPVRDTRDYWSDTVDELTSRELEVLGMVARGCQNKIIAADLGLSEHTVKIHLHNIISKLAVHNRTEAAAMYLKFANRREASDDFAARGQFGKEDGGSPSA